MADPNDKAFRSMLRSSTIKKACGQNAASNRERDIKTMSELAGDMARGMKISKRVSEKERAIGVKEGPHEARSRTLPSGSSLTDFMHSAVQQLLIHLLLLRRRLCAPLRSSNSSYDSSQPLISLLFQM
jgi:hypothetical protein